MKHIQKIKPEYIPAPREEEATMTHIDEWLDIPTFGDDALMYAKFVLDHFRKPAWFKTGTDRWMKKFKLFCTYEGKRYRVTGASRLGDVWLAEDPSREIGYDLRVGVDECSEWSDNAVKQK